MFLCLTGTSILATSLCVSPRVVRREEILGHATTASTFIYAKADLETYLGRYTHRVAISNNRLMRFDEVAFRWKDYKHGAAHKTITLTAEEFIRRFLLHVLPDGFKHIRSFGLLANRHRAARLATCRRLLGVVVPAQETSGVEDDYRDRYQRLTGRSLRDCPICGKGHMVCIETFLPGALPRAPPHIHYVL
jgi:hypothetical protein